MLDIPEDSKAAVFLAACNDPGHRLDGVEVPVDFQQHIHTFPLRVGAQLGNPLRGQLYGFPAFLLIRKLVSKHPHKRYLRRGADVHRFLALVQAFHCLFWCVEIGRGAKSHQFHPVGADILPSLLQVFWVKQRDFLSAHYAVNPAYLHPFVANALGFLQILAKLQSGHPRVVKDSFIVISSFLMPLCPACPW